MIVITRNGKTTVITGWRAWIISAVAIAAAWLVLALIVFFMIGAAVTIGLFLLLAIPAVVLVGLASGMFGRNI